MCVHTESQSPSQPGRAFHHLPQRPGPAPATRHLPGTCSGTCSGRARERGGKGGLSPAVPPSLARLSLSFEHLIKPPAPAPSTVLCVCSESSGGGRRWTNPWSRSVPGCCIPASSAHTSRLLVPQRPKHVSRGRPPSSVEPPRPLAEGLPRAPPPPDVLCEPRRCPRVARADASATRALPAQC